MTIGHTAIAAYLRDHHDIPPWWSQEVTVGYERIRGLREEHQTPRGYQVSVSKTLPVATETLYEAWAEEESRRRWLGDDEPHIRGARPSKSLRITWIDGRHQRRGGLLSQRPIEEPGRGPALQARGPRRSRGQARLLEGGPRPARWRGDLAARYAPRI